MQFRFFFLCQSILVCLTKRVSERTSDYKEDIIFSRDFLSTSAIDSVICFFREQTRESIFLCALKFFHIFSLHSLEESKKMQSQLLFNIDEEKNNLEKLQNRIY